MRTVKRRLLKLLVVSVVVFGCMWLPFFLFLVIFETRSVYQTSSQYLLVVVMATANGCVNPALIVHFHSQYRSVYRRIGD